MSNELVKETDTYTVKDFCEEYNSKKTYEEKQELIEKVMNQRYVDYELKVAICENIVECSYYKKYEDGSKKLHIYSPGKHMLYSLRLIGQYTKIKLNKENSLEEFNLLNKYDLIRILLNSIPEKEREEFDKILAMTESDLLQNEYETHSFISNQIERFASILGYIAKPALDDLNRNLENMDDHTINMIVSKILK